MTVWFTADQHFGHNNIIKYTGRPFVNAYEMDEEIIRRHNLVVQPDDQVWHVGDFTFNERCILGLLSRLNGHHRLIVGNHDRCHPCHKHSESRRRHYVKYGFEWVKTGGLIRTDPRIWVTHMPAGDGADLRYPEWRPDPTQYEWLLHGHNHDRWKINGHMINVGVDQWDFTPVSWQTLCEIMNISVDILPVDL
jgi:calcineurin-like phosphoesterase family protein